MVVGYDLLKSFLELRLEIFINELTRAVGSVPT